MNKAIAENTFRALARFPNDYSAEYSGTVENYSPECIDGFHDATIRIPFAEPDELKKLIRNSDFLLFDGCKVIAVCRNVKIKE